MVLVDSSAMAVVIGGRGCRWPRSHSRWGGAVVMVRGNGYWARSDRYAITCSKETEFHDYNE